MNIDIEKLLINPTNKNLMRSSKYDVSDLIYDISTNILLWDENDNSFYLDELGYQSEDCGCFPGIAVDFLEYENGDMEGNISINKVSYSFDLTGLFDDDYDFNEFPIFTKH